MISVEKANRDVYISVSQKTSFLSPPITQSGSVRCQLRPEPTAVDPMVTGCREMSTENKTEAVENIRGGTIQVRINITLT